MIKNYDIVNLLDEFSDIKDIDRISSIFEKEGWNLIRSKDNSSLFQLYFGEGKQVDNMYEYAFPHLLDRQSTKAELERFIKYRLSLEKSKEAYNAYITMPEYHKNNIKSYYIYDGIYTCFPDVSEEDAKFIFKICDRIENENINPFSIAHYLTDHYSRGNISKEDMENATSGEICEAVYYDKLLIDKDEIEKC